MMIVSHLQARVLGSQMVLPLDLHRQIVLLALSQSALLLLSQDTLQSFDFISDIHHEGYLWIHLSYGKDLL